MILPACNTAAMTEQLAEISAMVAPGKHAVVLLDQASWHLAGDLVVPINITLLPLPSKCPGLNPMENIWRFMRKSWLSNRVFWDDNDIVEHCCQHWNKLTHKPCLIPPSPCAPRHTGSSR